MSEREPSSHLPAPPPPDRAVDVMINHEAERVVAVSQTDITLRQYPTWLAYLTAALTVLTGVYSSMAFKWQLKTDAPGCDGCDDELFTGALFQTQLMFIGETLAIIIWFFDDRYSAKARKAPMFEFNTALAELTRKPTHWYFWPFACLHDFVATLMINTSLTYTYASTVQMLRNFMVVAAAGVQLVLIRKALTVHEWLGVLFITLAMILTAIPAFGEPEDSSFSTGEIVLGICLALGGTAVQASQLLFEEWILRRGRYPPLKAVGVEGIFGLAYSFIAWAPYQAIGVEDVTKSWYQQFHSGKLWLISGLYIPGALIFNGAGLATTKLAGGLLRGVCFACRSPLVWLVSLITKWQDYDNWNLGSMIVFIFAFGLYINKVPGLSSRPFMTKPIHFCCTNPALDGVMPGQDGAVEVVDQGGKPNDEPV